MGGSLIFYSRTAVDFNRGATSHIHQEFLLLKVATKKSKESPVEMGGSLPLLT